MLQSNRKKISYFATSRKEQDIITYINQVNLSLIQFHRVYEIIVLSYLLLTLSHPVFLKITQTVVYQHTSQLFDQQLKNIKVIYVNVFKTH